MDTKDIIIAHRGGIWASDSTELDLDKSKARQHTRGAYEAALKMGVGAEFDFMPYSSRKGFSSIALTGDYPVKNPSKRLKPEDVLDMRRAARAAGQTVGTMLAHVQFSRLSGPIAKLQEEYQEPDLRFIGVGCTNDWRHFTSNPQLGDKMYRMYADDSRMALGEEQERPFQQARGVFLEFSRTAERSPPDLAAMKIFMAMAARGMAGGKEVVLLLGDMFPAWGVDKTQHDEKHQPYRRSWREAGRILQDLVAEHPNANVKILTNFPVAAQDHFAPLFG